MVCSSTMARVRVELLIFLLCRTWAAHEKVVSCVAGGQNCGQSGGRNFFFFFFSLPFSFWRGGGLGKYCPFFWGGGEVFSRTFFSHPAATQEI